MARAVEAVTTIRTTRQRVELIGHRRALNLPGHLRSEMHVARAALLEENGLHPEDPKAQQRCRFDVSLTIADAESGLHRFCIVVTLSGAQGP